MPRGALKVNMEFEFSSKNEWILKKVADNTNKLDKATEKAAKTADKAAKGGFANLAGAYNALIVAGRMKDVFTSAVQPAIQMEQAMKRLAIATGATKEQQDALVKAARAAAATTPFNPAEAIEAMTTVHLATNDVESSVATLIPVLQLASTYLGGNVGRAANIAGDLIRGFGLNARDAALSLDMLVAAARFTRTKIEDLAPGIRKFAIAGGIAGTSFADVLKVFTLANASFRNAEANMTGLLRVVQRLSKATIAAPLEKYLKVAVIDQATGKMRPLIHLLRDMAMAAHSNEGQWAKFMDIMSTAAEARAVKPLIAAVTSLKNMAKEGMTTNDVLREFNKVLGIAEGRLTKQAAEAMQTMAMQSQILSDNIFKLKEAALGPMLFVLTPIVMAIRGFISGVAWLLTDIPVLSDVMRGLLTVFFGFIVTAGLAKVAALGVLAAHSVVGLATTWLAQQTGALTTAFVSEAAAANVAAGKVGFLGKALIGLRIISKGVRGAFKAMWTAIKGPFTWILLAVEAITWGIGKLVGKADKKTEDIAKKQQSKLLKQTEALGAAFNVQNTGISKLNKSIDYFKLAVDGWKNTIKSTIPVLPKQGLANIERGVEQAIRERGMGAGAAGKLRTAVSRVQKVYAKGGGASAEELKQAQASMLILSDSLPGLLPSSKKVAEGIKAVTEGLGNFRENSAKMAATLMWLEQGTDEYEDWLKKQTESAVQHIDALKNEAAAAALAAGKMADLEKNMSAALLGLQSVAPSGKAAEHAKLELARVAEWKRRAADVNNMLDEQTKKYGDLQKVMARFMQIRGFSRDELVKFYGQMSDEGLSPKEQKDRAAWGTLHGPGGAPLDSEGARIRALYKLPGAGAPADPMSMGMSMPGMGHARYANRESMRHMAATADNTVKTVKVLNKIHYELKQNNKPPAEPYMSDNIRDSDFWGRRTGGM